MKQQVEIGAGLYSKLLSGRLSYHVPLHRWRAKFVMEAKYRTTIFEDLSYVGS